MKIYNITPLRISNAQNSNNFAGKNKNANNNRNKNVTQTIEKYNNLPNTQQYLAFTGGYSLNLGKTIERLDALAQKRNIKLYPKNIREWAGMILEEGNKGNDTLIGIHKKYFANLKEAFSLQEVKERFPEFKDVVSVRDVDTTQGSFIDDFNNGRLEFFDNDEDLSLQLLKLYWADGFSLNDLKKYTGGKDIYHVLKQLHIPTVDKDYGHILKFSDPEYNERLTKEMSERSMRLLDKKAQIEEGEPVYIPKTRGPLSPEHRQRISEGLKEYYQQNPYRIYEMSERQKEFYRNNPDKAKELTRVLKKAWNIFNAKNIKAELSKFMKKNGIENFDPAGNPINVTKAQSDRMKQFWGINEWARKSFAKNMEYAWKKIKEENVTFYPMKIIPAKFSKFLEEKSGLEPGTLDNMYTYNPYTGEKRVNEQSKKIFEEQTNSTIYGKIMDETYHMSLYAIRQGLDIIAHSGKDNVHKDLLEFTNKVIERNLVLEKHDPHHMQVQRESREAFLNILWAAADTKNKNIFEIISNALDKSFEIVASIREVKQKQI